MTVYVKCVCDAFLRDPENETYVEDGKPKCPERVCEAVRKYRRNGLHNPPDPPFDPEGGVYD